MVGSIGFTCVCNPKPADGKCCVDGKCMVGKQVNKFDDAVRQQQPMNSSRRSKNSSNSRVAHSRGVGAE